jgi:predicted negative regulator of RcsB-dependent stress response
MFNWQASPANDSVDSGIVSKNFWIYWVISVPLTAGVLAGWRIWYVAQKNRYAAAYLQPQQKLGGKSGDMSKDV